MKLSHIGHLVLTLLVFGLVLSCSNTHPPADSPFPEVDPDLPFPDQPAPGDSAGFYEDYQHTDRLIWQKPDMVIDLLGPIDDKTIADIGAGSGFFALKLSQKAKKVIAIDIDPGYVKYLDSIKQMEVPTRFQDRLEARLGQPDDPKLEPMEVDIVLIVNTYMYLKNRVDYMRSLLNDLPDGGRVLIIDFKKKRTPLGPPQDIRLPLFEAENDLHEAGFERVTTNDNSLDYQYIILAEK